MNKSHLFLTLNISSKLLVSAGAIAFAAAIWHLLCILGGPSWFAFARAPQQIIDSAQQGTLLAPIGTIAVASLMFACSFYAFSATGLIRKMPLLKPALITISLLCTIRGLIVIPVLLAAKSWDVWEMVASSVWFYVGVCFILGTKEYNRLSKSHTFKQDSN